MRSKLRQIRIIGLRPGLWQDTSGQDLVEYALIAAGIAVVVAGFLPQDLMPAVSGIFSKIVDAFAKTSG